MAVGDQDDILARLKKTLPSSWFGPEGEFPAIEAFLYGAAWVGARIFEFYAYAKLQTRIATQTGGWLELTSADFFDDLRRLPAEADPKYSRRIRLEVFRDRNTRHAIDRAVFDLTGVHPDIYEAWRAGDCGGLGTGSLALGVAGRLGSRTAPTFEVFISMPTLQNYGIPNWPGLGSPVAGLGFGFALASDEDIQGSGPSFNDILAALERVRTSSITYYVRLVPLGDPTP